MEEGEGEWVGEVVGLKQCFRCHSDFLSWLLFLLCDLCDLCVSILVGRDGRGRIGIGALRECGPV